MSGARAHVVAEAGVNHNGSLSLAKQLVDVAAEAGADAVKFQTFRATSLVSRVAAKAPYQRRTTDDSTSQLAMLQALELDVEAHVELVRHCAMRHIEFLSTPFDLESLDLLARRLGLPRFKLSSGEITNAPLLLEAARVGRPIILSTGMSTLSEVEEALGVLAFGYTEPLVEPRSSAFRRAFERDAGKDALARNVTLLHCTSAYPVPDAEINLRAMDTLRRAFGLPVGLSDHSVGITVALAAVAREAAIVEKHFTLDRSMPGPDHNASLEPAELAEMIRGIRIVEQALGTATKQSTSSEQGNLSFARKSLVAARDIREGEAFTPSNLTAKRPGDGISPMRYWDFLGKTASQNFAHDEPIR